MHGVERDQGNPFPREVLPHSVAFQLHDRALQNAGVSFFWALGRSPARNNSRMMRVSPFRSSPLHSMANLKALKRRYLNQPAVLPGQVDRKTPAMLTWLIVARSIITLDRQVSVFPSHGHRASA
jgi:hypothetical protein